MDVKLLEQLQKWQIPLHRLGRDLVALIQRPGNTVPIAVYGRIEGYSPFTEIARQIKS